MAVAADRRSALAFVAVVSTDMDDDAGLLRAGQAGDRVALTRLFERHERSLYHLCLGMLAEASDAEDAVQETFLRVLRTLDSPGGFRGSSTVRTWLFRIAMNVCLDVRRARKRRSWLSFFGEIPEDPIRKEPSPEQMTMDRLRLQAALAALPPEQRTVLILREQEEWSIAEIALALGCTEKRAHNMLYRARRTLAKWREQEQKEMDRT